jgi:hypothetical protein
MWGGWEYLSTLSQEKLFSFLPMYDNRVTFPQAQAGND